MEINKITVICVVLACAAFTSVQSASFYYRTGREIEVPVENEIIREEIVAELKREPEITVVETEPIAAIIKEELVIPVEQLRVAAPAIEVQEPVAVISEKAESNAVVEEAVALRSADPETVIPVVVEEKIISVPIVEEPAAVAAVEEPIPKTRNEPLVNIDEKLNEPASDVQSEVKEAPIEVVLIAEKSNPIEEAVVVEKENVVVDVVPAVKIDESIRQSGGAPAEAATPTTVRPGVFQQISNQFQTQIQNFQHQIQSVFNPNAATAENAEITATPTTTRPNLINQFQNAVGQVFNRPQNALQTLVQNAQSGFQGIFRPQAAPSAAAATPAGAGTVPIVVAPADPVGQKTMLGEVPVVNEPAAVVETVQEKEAEKKSD